MHTIYRRGVHVQPACRHPLHCRLVMEAGDRTWLKKTFTYDNPSCHLRCEQATKDYLR
jgi:hypothetical protein